MNYTVSTPPGSEPLSLTEVKAHCRVDDANSDTLLTSLITAARIHAEKYLRRALITQTIDARYDYFMESMQIPRPTLQGVTYIKYIDTDGVEQTLSDTLYKVDIYSVPARIVPAYGEGWPSARSEINAITIRLIAGYGSASDVPGAIKQAMLLHIGHMFENREAVLVGTISSEYPMGYDALMATYRVWGFE